MKKVSLNHLMQDSPFRCMCVKYLQIFLKFILWLKQPFQNCIHVFFPTPGHSSSDGTKLKKKNQPNKQAKKLVIYQISYSKIHSPLFCIL